MATKLAFLLITFLVAASPYTEAAITCGGVLAGVSSCLGYLRSGGAPAAGCCDGAKGVYNSARTPSDRQGICRCIKTLVPSVGVNPTFLNALPGKCGINIPYRYSPSLDCSKVN